MKFEYGFVFCREEMGGNGGNDPNFKVETADVTNDLGCPPSQDASHHQGFLMF